MESQPRQNLTRAAALFLIIAIILPTARPENITYPTANQNLNPTQAWRSCEYCLWNTSSRCQMDKSYYKLTSSGWLNVTASDGPNFCEPDGCAEHTRAVLLCLKRVKRDYWFANNATVQDLYDTIDNGCSNGGTGFTGISKYGSHHSG